MTSKANLLLFLKDLQTELEADTITTCKLQQLGEFFMHCKMEQEIMENDDVEFTKQDMIKFISLGWYFYSILNKQEKIKLA